jgi:hypothetical protein
MLNKYNGGQSTVTSPPFHDTCTSLYENVKILTISFLIVINTNIIGKYYLIVWLPSNINIDVNLLTKGSDLLTYQENITIFNHAFKYIKDSKRFTIV